MGKVKVDENLENAEVGDELYFRHTILGSGDKGVKVAKVTKTLIVDSKGDRWRKRDGKPAGYVWSRGTMAHWRAYLLIERIP